MPPWHADASYGKFSNDRRLSDREKEILVRWVKQGAPAGDPADMPTVPAFGDGWRLGEPDLEVAFDAVELAGGGPDVFKNMSATYELPEDRWVQSIEILPSNRRVVHHVIIFVLEDGQQSPTGWLGAWAAGMVPMTFPEGTGRLLKKGSRIVADMHYHPTDAASSDQTRIGLHFLEGEPEKELVNLWVQNTGFKIPSGAENHAVRSSFTFRQDSVLYSLFPHMHYRGRDFTYTAIYPDGRRETLLRVPGYDFNWQTVYELEAPLDLPAGTRIDCLAHFDNSAGNPDNPDNPDPSVDVTFGNESFDEMMIGFVDYTVKEGLRPLSAEDRLKLISAELRRDHPGEVFAVRVWERDQNEDEVIETVLHFPSEGEGMWYIPINGELIEGRLIEVAGGDAGFSAILASSFGRLAVQGRGGFESSELSGEVELGSQKFSFSGRRVDSD